MTTRNNSKQDLSLCTDMLISINVDIKASHGIVGNGWFYTIMRVKLQSKYSFTLNGVW